MKHTATLEDANHSLDEAVSTLQNHLSKVDQNEPEQLKLANEYYKWTTLKTNLILNEKSFQIPPTALPNIIKPSSFKWLRPEKQAVVSKYYRYDKETDTYVISVKKQSVPCEDIEMIARSLVLIRKAVVWVDFGYNIGTEFGGRHPSRPSPWQRHHASPTSLHHNPPTPSRSPQQASSCLATDKERCPNRVDRTPWSLESYSRADCSIHPCP